MSRYVGAPGVSGSVVIRGVTVVDPVDGTAQAGQDVRVEAGRITAVDVTGGDPGDAHVVEGDGRYLVPGFMDMHAHPLNTPDDVDGAYALMLANGIVGFRQMSGSTRLLRDRRSGKLPSPTGAPALLATPGDLLTPLNASTVESAVVAVDEQHAEGADFIKAGFTTPDGLLAALAEARQLGLPLAGHLPQQLDPADAARGGMRCIEHLGTGITMFAAVSSREADVRSIGAQRRMPPLPKLSFPGAQWLVNRMILGMVTNPAARTSEAEAKAYRLADSTYDPERVAALAALFIEHGTWHCPTLIRIHTQQFGDSSEHTADPRRRYMAPDELRTWDSSAEKFAKLPQATREALHEHWDAQLRLTGALADAGVPLLAGTDACGAAGVIPGFALHDEFDLLARAGLGPLAILRSTTSDAATFLGIEDTAGRIATGYAADAVLLRQDPLADHAALHSVEGVLRGGGWWSRADLDAVLAAVAAAPGAR